MQITAAAAILLLESCWIIKTLFAHRHEFGIVSTTIEGADKDSIFRISSARYAVEAYEQLCISSNLQCVCWLFIFKVTEPSSIPYRTPSAFAKWRRTRTPHP
jgi:hypothetical protein